MLLQFVDANDMDDASEYDDAMSRLGSMSMSSAYSSDDDASPSNRFAGSPGRLTEVPVPLCIKACSLSQHFCHVKHAKPLEFYEFLTITYPGCLHSTCSFSDLCVLDLACAVAVCGSHVSVIANCEQHVANAGDWNG